MSHLLFLFSLFLFVYIFTLSWLRCAWWRIVKHETDSLLQHTNHQKNIPNSLLLTLFGTCVSLLLLLHDSTLFLRRRHPQRGYLRTVAFLMNVAKCRRRPLRTEKKLHFFFSSRTKSYQETTSPPLWYRNKFPLREVWKKNMKCFKKEEDK